MSESNVADRLKSFIERKGLAYSQFADRCGIPRPSLSQLLTGRNKKISDVMIGQIHNMFPELSIVWLLFGEGPMEPGVPTALGESQEFSLDVDDGLFSPALQNKQDTKKIVFSPDDKGNSEILKGESLKTGQKPYKVSDFKVESLQNKIKELQAQLDKIKNNPRKVDKIMVYYDDSTFEEFIPKAR